MKYLVKLGQFEDYVLKIWIIGGGWFQLTTTQKLDPEETNQHTAGVGVQDRHARLSIWYLARVPAHVSPSGCDYWSEHAQIDRM